jgi:hypothetical protein
MAEGYARVSSAFGVCLVIGGPGVTNIPSPVSLQLIRIIFQFYC